MDLNIKLTLTLEEYIIKLLKIIQAKSHDISKYDI